MLPMEVETFYFIRVCFYSHDELRDSRYKAGAGVTL